MTIQELLDKIKTIDIEPGIFNVYLMASRYLTGYNAWVSFRTYSTPHSWMTECRTRGDTPEVALQRLYDVLTQIAGCTCPHCGVAIDREDE